MKQEHIRMSVMRTIMQIVSLMQTCVIVPVMNGSQKRKNNDEQLQISPVSTLLSDLQHTNRHEENRMLYL